MAYQPFTVSLVKGSREEGRQFISFPKKLYADCPLYVPSFDQDMKALLDRKHPFFLHSRGEFVLIRKNGTIVARALVCENNRYNQYHQTNFAFFDCFDCIDDQETADYLFNYLSSWAREHGFDALTGPMLSGGAAGTGILVEGFDLPPAMTMMRYNYPYYRSLLEHAGFTKYLDLHSFSVPPEAFHLPDRIARLAEGVLKRGRFSVLRFRSKKELRRYIPDIKSLYGTTLTHHLEDYPLSDEELDQVARELLTVVDPGLVSLLAYDGKIIGYAFGFADITAALQKNGGALGPLALLRIITSLKKTKKVLFNGIGILPQYQGLGGNALLYREMEAIVKTRSFREAEMVQISEKTDLMLSDAGSLGAKPSKIHRMYTLKL